MSALHRMGKVNFVTSKPASAARSTNVTYKAPRKPKNKRRTAQVGKSFRIAYNKMQPSKELRFYINENLFTSPFTIADSTAFTDITAIAQGAQVNQRLQNSVHVSYIHLKGTAQNNSVSKTRCLRFTLFQERNHDIFNTTTFGNLYKNTSWTDATTDGKQKVGRYTINREQYSVLWDKTVKIKQEAEDNLVLNYKFKVNRKLWYPKAGSSTLVTNGRIYFVAVLFEPDDTLSDKVVDLEYMLRVFFKDNNKIY